MTRTPELIAELRERAGRGQIAAEIARGMGITHPTVTAWAQAEGIEVKTAYQLRRSWARTKAIRAMKPHAQHGPTDMLVAAMRERCVARLQIPPWVLPDHHSLFREIAYREGEEAAASRCRRMKRAAKVEAIV